MPSLILKLLFYCYLTYLLVFLVTGYYPAESGYDPPFLIFILDTVNLFIHEAGHLFFKPFGMWLHIIAGSFFQILIPLALAVVTFREKREQVPLPGFWLGESMVNVSAYIHDAPSMKLKLIARGLIHDWNWLIGGNEDVASVLGWTVFGLGILICAGSVVLGAFFAVRTYRAHGGG
jgi:hypothetical protein